MQHLIYPSPYN